jgi:fructosamine-3-kinase
MPQSESAISWPVLRQVVRDWAGSDADLTASTPLAGGSVNTTLLLSLADGSRAVLKITPHRVDLAYADEVYQLGLLRAAGVPTPAVYAMHPGSLDKPYSYLLLEYVDGVDLHAAKKACPPEEFDAVQRELADALLKLHATAGSHYMRVSRRDVPRHDAWHACYRDIFDGIWQEVAKTPVLPVKLRKVVSRTHDRLDRLLSSDDGPRLLHWDVWSTNLLCRPDAAGRWHLAAVLDPNCKFGSPEAELAYLDLFHTVTPAFFKAYQRERKLPPEYHQVRKHVYQLYSLMNHARLFGGEYGKALCAQAEKVGALV